MLLSLGPTREQASCPSTRPTLLGLPQQWWSAQFAAAMMICSVSRSYFWQHLAKRALLLDLMARMDRVEWEPVLSSSSLQSIDRLRWPELARPPLHSQRNSNIQDPLFNRSICLWDGNTVALLPTFCSFPSLYARLRCIPWLCPRSGSNYSSLQPDDETFRLHYFVLSVLEKGDLSIGGGSSAGWSSTGSS